MESTIIDPEAGSSGTGGGATRLLHQVSTGASRLAEKGVMKVGELAEGRKQEAVQKLDAVVEVIRDFADTAGGAFGEVLGGAVNRGGDAVDTVAQTLRRKSVEDMVGDTRSAIVRHPGVAIGAASLVGFVAGRIAKGGLHQAAVARRPFSVDIPTEEGI